MLDYFVDVESIARYSLETPIGAIGLPGNGVGTTHMELERLQEQMLSPDRAVAMRAFKFLVELAFDEDYDDPSWLSELWARLQDAPGAALLATHEDAYWAYEYVRRRLMHGSFIEPMIVTECRDHSTEEPWAPDDDPDGEWS
ncbi:hypothetical protein HN358_03740 [Candidatus Uhrbacteria bacterium]|jgi:hypothetical protein|nr:hypothetical protein [Candidatus Uhrbacteria bacterium]MBT7717668.1 hypothetical protein [Candidatus Uhrbacteria bacterium]